MSDQVHRFVGSFGPHLINECTTASLSMNMDIARIPACAQILEDHKTKQRAAREHDRGQHKRAQSTSDMNKSRGKFRPPFPWHPSYLVASTAPQP